MPFAPLIIAFLGYTFVRKLVQRFQKYRRPANGSYILAALASPYMAEIARGKYEDLYYSVVVAMTDPAKKPAAEQLVSADFIGSAMYRIDLPFVTRAHLIGVPTHADAKLQPSNAHLEQVVLEGDFPNYFTLYAAKGQQAHTRYVLDPAAMQYIISFCETFNWEIIGDQLIFLQPHMPSAENAGDVLGVVKGFVDHIRPAVEEKVSDKRHVERAAYGEERRVLLCPLCAAAMTPHERYLTCPQGHGILAYGSILSDLRSGSKEINLENATQQEHGVLRCPACHNQMAQIKYDATLVTIDTCSNCPYRWLDAGEMASIKSR